MTNVTLDQIDPLAEQTPPQLDTLTRAAGTTVAAVEHLLSNLDKSADYFSSRLTGLHGLLGHLANVVAAQPNQIDNECAHLAQELNQQLHLLSAKQQTYHQELDALRTNTGQLHTRLSTVQAESLKQADDLNALCHGLVQTIRDEQNALGEAEKTAAANVRLLREEITTVATTIDHLGVEIRNTAEEAQKSLHTHADGFGSELTVRAQKLEVRLRALEDDIHQHTSDIGVSLTGALRHELVSLVGSAAGLVHDVVRVATHNLGQGAGLLARANHDFAGPLHETTQARYTVEASAQEVTQRENDLQGTYDSLAAQRDHLEKHQESNRAREASDAHRDNDSRGHDFDRNSRWN